LRDLRVSWNPGREILRAGGTFYIRCEFNLTVKNYIVSTMTVSKLLLRLYPFNLGKLSAFLLYTDITRKNSQKVELLKYQICFRTFNIEITRIFIAKSRASEQDQNNFLL
jgi:hypothetical protein